MIDKTDLTNRQAQPMRGQAEADKAIADMKGRPTAAAPGPADDPPPADLATLRARITKARSVAPPAGDNQFAQGCFRRGRDAALAIIDGESAG